MKIVFSTSCDLNYLALAHVLAKSTKEIYPESIFLLGLNESSEKIGTLLSNEISDFDYVYSGKDLDSNFRKLEKRYGIIELCCSTKPSLLLKAAEMKADLIVYLDPDSWLKGELVEVFDLIINQKADLVFTPHLRKMGNIEMEVSSMKHGLYNLGFLAISNNQRTIEILNWWRERLEFYCIQDPQRGIFTDQTWATLASGFVESRVIRNPAYNFATWNLTDHQMTFKNNVFFVDENPLVFAHFSSFLSDGIASFEKKYGIRRTEGFNQLINAYQEEVDESKNLLHYFLQQKKNKVHYKKHSWYSRSWAENRIMMIDRLFRVSPRFIKILMWAKKRVKIGK